jgi:short-subunit dehydrogenase
MPEGKTCLIVGAGPGNGLAIARRFNQGGYRVALLARSPDNLRRLQEMLPAAHCQRCDVTLPDELARAIVSVRADLGQVAVMIYNAGSGMFGSIDDVSAEDFEAAWRVNALGCFHAVYQVLPDMRSAGGGNIVIIGATASKRGSAAFAAFASAKGAQYNLAQSLARHLGPEGIHVSYAVIDGVIALERTRARLPDKPEEFFLQPDDIAAAVYDVTQQRRSAWTFEFDLRPFAERW